MRKTHKLSILKAIAQKGGLTASDFRLSNANQYLIALENEGLIIRRWSGGCKLAFINVAKLEQVKKVLEGNKNNPQSALLKDK